MGNASPRIVLGIFAEDGPLAKTLASTRGKLAAFDKSVRKLERNRAFRSFERDLKIVDRNLTAATIKGAIFGGVIAAAGLAGAAGVYVLAAALAVVGVGMAALSGLALVGIGIAFVSQSKQVKAAWKETTTFIKAEGLKLAAPLEQPMVRLAASMRDAFILIGPSLASVFAMAAPLVDQFGEGLKNNAESTGRVLVSAMSAGIPVLQALGSGFATYVLPGLRGFFDELTEGSGVLSGFATSLMQGLGNALPYIGEALIALIPMMRTIHADLISPMIDGFKQFADVLLANGDATGSFVSQLGTTIQAALPALANFLVAAQPIGQIFLALIVPGINAFSGALSSISGPLQSVAGFLENNKTAATVLGTAIVGTVVAVKAFNAVMLVYRTVTAAATAVSAAFSAVLALNPITLVVIAIAALIAILVACYLKFETFRNIVNGVFEFIKNAAALWWQGVQMYFNLVIGIAQTVWSAIKTYFGLVKSYWTTVITAAASLYSGVKSAFTNVVVFVMGIPGRILSALGDLGGLLLTKGKQAIQGFLDGLGSMLNKVKNKAKEIAGAVTGPISSVLKIFSPSRVLRGLGQYAGQGLVLGLEDQRSAIVRTMTSLAQIVAGTDFAIDGPNLSSSSLRGAGAARRGGTVNNFTVEVSPFTNPTEVAREMDKILRNGKNMGVVTVV